MCQVLLFNLVHYNLSRILFWTQHQLNGRLYWPQQNVLVLLRFPKPFLAMLSIFCANIYFELINGLKLAGVLFAFWKTSQKEIRSSEIWRSGWPVNTSSFWHYTFSEFPLKKINCLICSVTWRTVLLKPKIVKTFCGQTTWANIHRYRFISVLDCFVFSEEKYDAMMALKQTPAQTVTFWSCNGISCISCEFFVPQKRQFCLLTPPGIVKWTSSVITMCSQKSGS